MLEPIKEAPSGRILDRRQSNTLTKPKPWPIEKFDEQFNPEELPKSLYYKNGPQPRLGELRDKIRKNRIFHAEYQPDLDLKHIKKTLGKEIYDEHNGTFTDAIEGKDLISVAKPIHEARIRRYIKNATHDTEPRVFDPGYNEEGSKKRITRTSIIDAKQAEERTKNTFNLKEHNQNIA